ncbi:hypothetical protein F8M41_007665 [Gigaspora margarita]|uniref:Heterokaryon incompatibility domain-containing protein n=1 Tax=Gigaspora margarita TaxID=4874 RepID=A0A8H4AW53_GIGMA|nr:hypothetical protein F8M41_007665 [Gigaspora margarita]
MVALWTYDFIMGGIEFLEWWTLLSIGIIISVCYDIFENAYLHSAPRLQDVVYNNDEEKPNFRAYVLQLVAMSEVYRQAAIVVVLLEQNDFGNGPEFTLNKAAILNLKRWTQDVWTAQEHIVNINVLFSDKNGSMIHEANILSLLEYAKQNGDIEAAEILTIFYKVKECRIRRAVSLGDAWYLVSDRLTDNPLNYILGILGILHPMIRHHFIIGEHKTFEDGMQQILRLACERGDLSWLHLVGKKLYSSEKCNLLVPTPGEKQLFDVEYNRAGAAEGENLSLGMDVYLVTYLICLHSFDFDDKFAIVEQAYNGETHLIGTIKGKYHGTSDPTHWISIA